MKPFASVRWPSESEIGETKTAGMLSVGYFGGTIFIKGFESKNHLGERKVDEHMRIFRLVCLAEQVALGPCSTVEQDELSHESLTNLYLRRCSEIICFYKLPQYRCNNVRRGDYSSPSLGF